MLIISVKKNKTKTDIKRFSWDCLLSDEGKLKDGRGAVGDPVPVVRPVSYEPDDVVAARGYELPLLFESGDLAVGEEIADQLTSLHPKWDEAVPGAGASYEDGCVDEPCVEVCHVWSRLPDALNYFLPEGGNHGLCIDGLKHEEVAVDEQPMRVAAPHLACRAVARCQDLALLCLGERLPPKPLVEQGGGVGVMAEYFER